MQTVIVNCYCTDCKHNSKEKCTQTSTNMDSYTNCSGYDELDEDER